MIYCVEDDKNIRELIIYTLRTTGYDACGFAEGRTFWDALEDQLPELILLDIMLPGEDGIRILSKLQGSIRTKDIPVIMVTAKGSEYDKVAGLEAGADDYIAKPFGMMELVARIKAVLRRSEKPEKDAGRMSMHDLLLDLEKHEVRSGGEVINLTLKEFELLHYLMRNPGIVLTRNQILEKIWGYDFSGETRTVDVHVRTLRQKLGPQGQWIETVRGVGYRMRE